MSKYTFRLEKDLPPGFMINGLVPELPVVYEYLSQFDGYGFESTESFMAAMSGFPIYLSKRSLPVRDTEIRRGIFLRDENTVGVFNEGPSGWCAFGKLEMAVQGRPIGKAA